MKAVLQHKLTKLYFQEAEKWTADVSAARDFGQSLDAIAYRLKHDVRDVEVVLKFQNPNFDIRIDPIARPTSNQHRP